MSNTKSYTTGVNTSDQELANKFGKIQDALCDLCLNSAGLAIGTGSKKKIKVVSDTYVMAGGVLVKVAAATEVTLTTDHNVTADKFNVIVLSVDDAGAVTATAGTEGDTLADVVFPEVPADEAVIGFVIINPTGTGNFVGGTTDLDDGTVIPNAVYINTPNGFNTNMFDL